VKQEIRLAGGEVYPVIYSMALSEDGQWRMRNIIVNGVNMGLTYRNQFASAVQDARYQGDMDKVIEGWIASVGKDEDEDADAPTADAPTADAAAEVPAAAPVADAESVD